MAFVRCKDCVFYDESLGDGRCLRKPPVVVSDTRGWYDTIWPAVKGWDGCGEGEPKKEKKSK